jgi:TetR/AcrR family transcriptional repressor of nem operon
MIHGMPRARGYDRNNVAARAMEQFWTYGYYATSIRDLVRATGVSRHALYSEFADKQGLFVAALGVYFDEIVTPAFAAVESRHGRLSDIRAYFETQVGWIIQKGLPATGCMIANTMVESGPHEKVFRKLIAKHVDRLKRGFRSALENECAACGRRVNTGGVAEFLTISAQGLWSYARLATNPDVLRGYVDQLLAAVEKGFAK